MTYYRWMMKKYRYDVTAAGSLAREMKLDPEFPRSAGRTEVLDHLLRCGATSNCIWTFEDTWQEYDSEIREYRRRKKEPYRRVWKHHRRKRGRRNEGSTQ